MPDTFSNNQIQPESLDHQAQPEARDSQAQPEEGLKTFRDLGVAEPICAALEAAGMTAAFPIQALAVPIALDGQDLIGQARTGTGKTLAFGIPLLQRLGEAADDQRSAPRSLVVVPTRELAIQVADDLRIAGSRLGTRVVTVYGGRAYEPQIEALATADLVVGTPGRLLDLARQGHLKLSKVTGLVLDEADKMLDLASCRTSRRSFGSPRRSGRPCSSRPPCRARWLRWRGATCAGRLTCGPSTTTSPRTCRAPSSTCSARTRWTRSRSWPASCKRKAGA